MNMNISIVTGFRWTEESLRAALNERRKQSRFSESEFVESVLSLAAMVDSVEENEKSDDLSEDKDGGINICGSQEKFSFFCGWDRLAARFRESCSNRNLQSVGL